MTELPTGTVTFLFTDIEGSTRLLQEQGERYADALAEHRSVLREAFERHGGVEVDTQGDAFFAAFGRASDALAAAEQAQRTLQLPVRIGIHTGEPQVTEGGYVGIDVHRAARICSAAHGGQVVVSQATQQLLEGAALRDLGEHRLKDLGQPVRLYQQGDREFPPLRSLNQTNLPAQPSPLVGRERELAELQPLVRESRIVTMTGPGGSGKTRLALQVAAELVEGFEDGVFWVPLAAITDPELVAPALAQAVGAQNGLAEHVRDRHMLLLLDNLEQVIDVAPSLAQLLERCPNLRLLATSRAPLRIAGERDYPVEPLPEADAVELFRERAAVVEPLDAVREICRRLDGLPLAIELAAARTRLLPPDGLLARLDHALPVLTGGRRDAPERQRTLRATIEWSYDLLDGDEQRLFRRLAVFAGSFTVESAEEVCDADLETLESLLEQSLVRRWASGRLGMLETIREFAAGLLGDSGEADEISRRHAEFFRELAQSTNLSVEGIGTGEQRYDVVLPEQANIRAAVDWALEADPELGLRIACSLENFWVTNNPVEGSRLFRTLLDRARDIPDDLRARGLRCLASSAYIHGDFERGALAYEDSLALYRQIGDERGISNLLMRLTFEALRTGDDSRARALATETLAISRKRGFKTDEAQALSALGELAYREGRHGEAFELCGHSVDICRETGFRWWEKNVLHTIADYALRLDRVGDAVGPARSGLAIAHEIADRMGIVYGLALFAWIAATQRDGERAGRLWGAIEAEEERGGHIGQWEDERTEYQQFARAGSGAEFERGRADGRAMSSDQAVEYALRDLD